MSTKKTPRKKSIRHAAIVGRFAARLRELRRSRGLTQLELAEKAHVTVSYVSRLEAGSAAPGIDLVERLAEALQVSVADLLPTSPPPDSLDVLRERADALYQTLRRTADRETLLLLVPFLARLADDPAKGGGR